MPGLLRFYCCCWNKGRQKEHSDGEWVNEEREGMKEMEKDDKGGGEIWRIGKRRDGREGMERIQENMVMKTRRGRKEESAIKKEIGKKREKRKYKIEGAKRS